MRKHLGMDHILTAKIRQNKDRDCICSSATEALVSGEEEMNLGKVQLFHLSATE